MSKEINVKGYFPSMVVQQPRCIGCSICAITCPDMAIEIAVNGVQYVFSDY
jgi:2-oxoglutarate ferredoxin oxidoreductase subunit delta